MVGLALAAVASGLAAQTGGRPGPVTVTQLDRADGESRTQSAGQEPARAPAPLQPLAVTQLDEQVRTDDLANRRPISLSFSEPVPITDVLLLLVRDTNLSMVPDADLAGAFTGELKDVTLRQALEIILQPLSLDYSVQDNIIRVFRRRMVTRIFDLNYVITRRSGLRSLGASSAAGGGGVFGPGGAPLAPGARFPGLAHGSGLEATGGSSAQVSGRDGGDLFEEFEHGLQTVLSDEAKYSLDRKAGILHVTDFPDRLEKIALYLDAVQIRVNRQVQIEARVIEVELNDTFAAGIDWSLVLEEAGDSVSLRQTLAPATSGGLTMGLDIKDFNSLLTAFATQGTVNVLSSPQVMAMNNEPALMRVGTQDVYFVTTAQVDETTGRIVQTTVTPTPITEGVVLGVTPQIGGDGMIHMSISPSITERTGQATSRLGDTVPILSVRETDTLVRVHSGETVVIAGLMQERVGTDIAKVPVLGDLPLVGGIFRRREQNRRKTDLVILLTPTIMTPGRMLDTTAEARERLSEAQSQPRAR